LYSASIDGDDVEMDPDTIKDRQEMAQKKETVV
jgi:hypothetical protein